MTFSIDNPEGVATTPFEKYVLEKTLRRTRVKALYLEILNDADVASACFYVRIVSLINVKWTIALSVD